MAEFRAAPGGYVSPIDGTIADNSSGTFGAVRDGGSRKHAGNDFQTPTGSPALAVVGGKVIYVGDNQGYRHNAVVLGDDGNA
jgi:murein DD-endopeptidase MepM/ murein hydrolase activator NlpD